MIQIEDNKVTTTIEISKNFQKFFKLRKLLLLISIISMTLLFLISLLKYLILDEIKHSGKKYFEVKNKYSIFLLDKVEELLEDIDLYHANDPTSFIQKITSQQKQTEIQLIAKKIPIDLKKQNKELSDQYDSFINECNQFINKNKKNILKDLRFVLQNTVNKFKFLAAHCLILQNITLESRCFNKSLSNLYNNTNNLNLKSVLCNFNSALKKLSDNSSYETYQTLLSTYNSSIKKIKETEDALNIFSKNMNVNQETFGSYISELRSALSIYSHDIQDSDAIVIRRNLDSKNLQTELLVLECFRKMENMAQICVDALRKKLAAILCKKVNFKLKASKKVNKFFSSNTKESMINALNASEICIFFAPLIVIIILLISIIKGKKEIKHYKVLVHTTIISIVIISMFILHNLFSLLSNYIFFLSLIMEKTIKRNFYPWIFFKNYCLKVCNFCLLTFIIIINNGILLPLLITILQQNIKTIYNQKFLFILFITHTIFAIIASIILILKAIKGINKYFLIDNKWKKVIKLF